MEVKQEYINSLKKVENLDIEKLLKSYEKQKEIGIRFNTKKVEKDLLNAKNIEKITEKFNILGSFSQISWCKSGFYYHGDEKLGKSILHEIGMFYMQEPSAMSPVEFLDVEPNDFVLDLCASPGGKTTQIAEKLETGFVVANEIVPKRAKILQENVQRLGLNNVIVINHSPKDIENKFCEAFDKILIDAPCSGEGMFRKNDDAQEEWTSSTPTICANRQTEILESAYRMLKTGGTMIYSTCTFSLEENEEVINKFLKAHYDLELVDIDHNKYNFENGNVVDGNYDLKKCARLYPYKVAGEGHFFAKIHKKILDKEYENVNVFLKKSQKNIKNNANYAQNIKIFNEFAKNILNVNFSNFVCFDNFLYANCPFNLNGLKVLSAGLFLGEVRKNNFFPSLHLARFLKKDDVKNCIELSNEDTKKYIEGYELVTNNADGWTLLFYKNLPICFGKCVQGKIKNHYPKYLRKKL